MIQFRKLVSGVLSLSTALTLGGLGLVSSAYALPLTETFVTLGDSRGASSSTYIVSFKVASATSIKSMKFTFANRASGAVVVPPSWDGSSATLLSVKKNTVAAGSFAINTSDATNGNLSISDSSGIAVAAGNTLEITLGAIVNNSATVSGGNECDTIANSDTCYVRVTTYSNDDLTGAIDASVASYTVVSSVQVQATVDPSLTFTVSAVNSGNIAGNDSNASCANPVTSTTTTLPFGNLGVGIAKNKCTQHSLAVATNANFGYDTYLKFIGAAAASNMMEGTISGNNIDPYTGTFGTPTAFSADPTGVTANVNTGWLGVRSTTIGAFGGSNLYAGPTVNNDGTGTAPGDKVMTKASPDLGTTPTYVTYKIAVNSLQPSDTYTGTAVYNVVAKY